MGKPVTTILLLALLLFEDGISFQVERHRRIIEQEATKGANVVKYYALIYWEFDVSPQGWVPRQTELCGGVIIDENHLLSAAHCFEDYKKYVAPLKRLGNNYFNGHKSEAWVYFGNFSEDIGEFKKIEFLRKLESFPVQDIKIHEHYANNDTHFLNDIAIIKVKGSFDPEMFVRMCGSGDKSGSNKLVVSGTGRSGTGVISRALKSAEVEETDKKFCENVDFLRIDPGSYVCTKGVSACSGDSGGPLVLVDAETDEPVCIYGIVSHLIQSEENVDQVGKHVAGDAWSQCLAAEGIRYASVKYFEQWVLNHLDPGKE